MISKLGLGQSPETITYIFVGEAESPEGVTPWYEWDHDGNKAIPIKEDALTGYIYNIVVNTTTFKGNPHYKVNIHVNADKKYVIRSGAGTTFTRGLVLSLHEIITADPDMLKHPVTITIKQSDESKAMFAGVFLDGVKHIPKWDSEIALAPLIADIQKALGQVVQTKEMMDDKDLYRQAQLALREEASTPKKRGDKNGRAKSKGTGESPNPKT